MNANPFEMLKQLGSLKSEMEKLKSEMKNVKVTGSSGAGMVNITLNGEYHVETVEISDELMKMGDKGMIEVLVASAFNDAGQRLQETLGDRSREMATKMGVSI